MERKVSIIEDLNGKKVVFIHDIRFKGKRTIHWEDVESYLRDYIGELYYVTATEDEIFIGSDLPKEYAGSVYTKKLKGANAKAKANATQGIPEMIEIAANKQYEENHKEKHSNDAKHGWYKYDTRFALPVFDESGEVERYNVFYARLLVRHAGNGKKYLYDIIEIKKEMSNYCQE
ncbi:MAG: hypothetical protein Q4E57_02365 [Eubacteriales bacterium]|nr:hypothetical protein [Eubacteriales bacterium]